MTDRTSPEIETLIRRLEARFDDGLPYLLAASEVRPVLDALRKPGVAPTPDLQVGWRWKWGEPDFWKMTDDPALVPESAPIKEPLYIASPDTSTLGNSK